MPLKHQPGLIQSGSILHESYYRSSRATDEAKEKLGLDPNVDYKANVAIARMEEYFVSFSTGLNKDKLSVIDLEVFDTTVRAVSLYVNNANQDMIKVHVYNADGNKIITQQFNRNQTPLLFPPMPLPSDAFVVIEALTAIDYVSIVFEPCEALDFYQAPILNQEELPSFINNLRQDINDPRDPDLT